MKIKFLEDRVVKDGNQNTPLEESYHEGQMVDLPQSSAEHWISRGVAVRVDEKQAKESDWAHIMEEKMVEKVEEKVEEVEVKTSTTTARPLVSTVSASTVPGAVSSMPVKEATVSSAAPVLAPVTKK